MLQLVTLVALSLLAVAAEADEVCESTLLQAHRGRLEEASPSPGITINSTEAEAVTSCPEGADCTAAGNGGCWFGRWRHARDYQCVYVYRLHYNAVEVFYCHDCKVIRCGFSPRAMCWNFHAPDPCASTPVTTTSMTSSAATTTIVTTAAGTTITTTTIPTTTTIRTSTTTTTASASTTTTNAASPTTTTTTTPPVVMLWKTSWEYIPGHDVAGCLALRGSNVVGANCWVDPDCCSDNELWEFTEEGQIVEFATRLCLTAVEAELTASEAHMKTMVKTCDAGDPMQRFVTNSESFKLQLEGDRSLCLDWDARGGVEGSEKYPVYMRECNNTHTQRWLSVLKVAKLRTSFTDGEESCLSFDNINVEGGACSQAPVWNWRFSTNQLWTKFSDDIPELCLMRIDFVLSIQDVVLAPCDSTKLEQKFTILAERTIRLLEDDRRPGLLLCLDWDVEARYDPKDNVYMYYCNDQLNQLWLPIAP
ncbi:ADAMTS9 [Symbiodinium sp. CCMP2456]|nr:ADAMTS9 [Symbiodinium sp. CCMP2456]